MTNLLQKQWGSLFRKYFAEKVCMWKKSPWKLKYKHAKHTCENRIALALHL